MKYHALIKKFVLGIACAAMLVSSPAASLTAYAGNTTADDIIYAIRNVPDKAVIKNTAGQSFTANMSNGSYVTDYPGGNPGECFAYVNELNYYLFGKHFANSYKGIPNWGTEAGAYTALATVYNNNSELTGNVRRSNYGSPEAYKTAVQQLLAKAVPGDILMAGNGKEPHFMVFMYSRDTTGDGLADFIYTAEGNVNNTKKIAIEYEKSVDYFINVKGKAMSVYHCRSNPVSGTASTPVQPSSGNTSAESTLAINNVSEIGTINEGKTYSLTGTVNSNYTITNVTGTIYSSSGSSIYSKSVAPNSTYYALRNSKIDYAMLFNKLSAGSYTYKVTASDAKGNYKEVSRSFSIKGYDQPAAQAESSLAITGVSPIGSIKEGRTYPIDGVVTSNYTITNVTGTIYDANGNTVYTKSINPGGTYYKLKYSTIDNAMLFNYLSAGSYTYKVSASDSKGGYRENSQNFSIEGNNAEAEAKARAEAEAKAKAEAEAKAKEESSSSNDDQIIILPDEENEDISLSGDTGRFDLHLAKSSSTESFTAASDKLTIVTRGQVEDLVNGGIRTDASRHFSMYLYDVTDGSERYVSGYYANCDNIEGGIEFDVQEGHKYKIRLETDRLSYYEAVTGDGHAYPIR